MASALLDRWESEVVRLLDPIVDATPFASSTYRYVPIFVAAFGVFFYMAYFFWGVYGLKGKKRGELSSCAISIGHGLITTVLASNELWKSWPFQMDLANSSQQTLLLQFSTAYMLADTLFFLLPFTPSDILFMGHHAMTSTYMAAALALHRGGISVMVLMAIGESTSIFQNSWIIARNCRHDNKVALKFFEFFSPIYTVIFVIVRSIIGPPAVVWLSWRLVNTPGLPPIVRNSWAGIAVLGVLGSQVWSYKLVRGLRRQMSKPRPKAE